MNSSKLIINSGVTRRKSDAVLHHALSAMHQDSIKTSHDKLMGWRRPSYMIFARLDVMMHQVFLLFYLKGDEPGQIFGGISQGEISFVVLGLCTAGAAKLTAARVFP